MEEPHMTHCIYAISKTIWIPVPVVDCPYDACRPRSKVKSTVSDKKNLQITLAIYRETYLSITTRLPFFSQKNRIIVVVKRLFIGFHSVAQGIVSLHGKIS